MNLDALAEAVIGGILGGGITGTVAYLQLRTDRRQSREARRWQDGETLADAGQLLTDTLPERRGFNIDPDPAAEMQKSALLNERKNQVSRQLLWLAAGHYAVAVRERAGLLSAAIDRAVTASEWHVRDMQAGRDPEPWLSTAQLAHAEAEALTAELQRVVTEAAEGKPRSGLARLRWW